jgi:hypothetical protein
VQQRPFRLPGYSPQLIESRYATVAAKLKRPDLAARQRAEHIAGWITLTDVPILWHPATNPWPERGAQ